jgi:hypothetical protein
MFDEQQHALPARFEFVCEMRNPRDVIWDGHVGATGAGESREIARRRQIGAGDAAAANFQFDAEQRVLHVHLLGFVGRGLQTVRARAQGQNPLAVKARHPSLAERLFNLRGQRYERVHKNSESGELEKP